MKLQTVFKLFIFIILLFGLSSCKNEVPIGNDTFTVSLFRDGELISQQFMYSYGDIIDFRYLESDGQVFVGWSDGDNIYYPTYEVKGDTTLTAIFEDVNDVFEVSFYEEGLVPIAVITGYTGEGKYLKIPQMIDDHIVGSIDSNAFEASSIIEIQLPIDAHVRFLAFKDSVDLKSVSFYGEYLLYTNTTINSEEYNAIIAENSNECIITETTEEGWVFKDNCPIIEVLSHSNIVVINNVEYSSYHVLLDKNKIHDGSDFAFDSRAFQGATALESIEIPINDSIFWADAFEGCPNLKNITIDPDSPYLSVVDGILYNKDGTKLVYYPAGKDGTEYVFPAQLELVLPYAFYNNTKIEKISINELFTGDVDFKYASNLNEIIVDEQNIKYQAVDGILYKFDELVTYPAAKIGTSYTVPEGILKIANYAFAQNLYLESIDFGNQITYIGMGAFENTHELKEINLPPSVEFLGIYALNNSSVDTIIINRNAATDSVIFFLGMLNPTNLDMGITIYVLDQDVNTYKTDLRWSHYADAIFPISSYTSED